MLPFYPLGMRENQSFYTRDDDNMVRLWFLDPSDRSEEEFLSSLLPFPLSQRIQYDLAEPEEILASNDFERIKEGADFFRQKSLESLEQALQKKYFFYSKELYEKCLEGIKKESSSGKGHAEVYASLGMLYLGNKEYSLALDSAKEGKKIEEKPAKMNRSIEALIYLFARGFQEAEELYFQWEEENGFYPENFLEDLLLMEKIGLHLVSLSDFPAPQALRYSELQKIKKRITDNLSPEKF